MVGSPVSTYDLEKAKAEYFFSITAAFFFIIRKSKREHFKY